MRHTMITEFEKMQFYCTQIAQELNWIRDEYDRMTSEKKEAFLRPVTALIMAAERALSLAHYTLYDANRGGDEIDG